MTGGPQNLYNLFSRFPDESYCILTSYDALRQRELGGKWLTADYFFYDHPGKIERRSTFTRDDDIVPARTHRFIVKATSGVPQFGRDILYAVSQAVYLVRSIAMIVQSGTQILSQLKIDCLLAISDNGPSLIATYLMSRRTGIPYVLYFFDVYAGNLLQPLNYLFARFFEPRLFRSASLILFTNDATERYYKRRYGDAFRSAVVSNSTFPEDYEGKRTPYVPREPYVVVFTGNLYWAQERSLMNLLRALHNFDFPVQVHLYIPNVPGELRRALLSFPEVRLSSAPPSKMPDIQCRATILYLPLSWHTKSPDIIATATPGKLTEYLGSGRPILIHAPSYAYVSSYARQAGFAHVVDKEDPQILRESIRKLALDVQYSRKLIKNAKRILKENHDATLNAQKLAGLLNTL
jgi:glycosyltransferase involved in cell wall biosynthesis